MQRTLHQLRCDKREERVTHKMTRHFYVVIVFLFCSVWGSVSPGITFSNPLVMLDQQHRICTSSTAMSPHKVVPTSIVHKFPLCKKGECCTPDIRHIYYGDSAGTHARSQRYLKITWANKMWFPLFLFITFFGSNSVSLILNSKKSPKQRIINTINRNQSKLPCAIFLSTTWSFEIP